MKFLNFRIETNNAFRIFDMIPSIYKYQKKMYKGKKLQESSIIHKTLSTSLLTESPNQTFEREIDNYTRLLEQDKRKFFRVQQNRNEVVKEHLKRAKELETLKGKQFSSGMVKMKGKVKILENQLDKTINSYNEVLSSNKKLKKQIDELRKEKLNQKEVMSKITSKISEYSQLIEQEQADADRKKEAIQQDKQGILSVKAQNEYQAKMFRAQVSNAHETLGNSLAGSHLIKRKSEIQDKHESTDNLPFARYRLRHLIARNKQRVKVIENYRKTMETIWRGFEDIKQESAINDIEQITSTFLKHEQQNHFIYEYIGKLGREIEDINDDIEQLREQITAQRDKNEAYEKDLKSTPKKVQIQKAKQEYVDKCKGEIEAMDNFLSIASQQFKNLGGEEATRFNLTQQLANLQLKIDRNFALKDGLGSTNIFFEDMTKYTKGPPNYAELMQESREEKFMESEKLRDFASDFWERRKGKAQVK